MRNPAVDAVKAIASQIIVLHHLALYSPMSGVLELRWSTLMNWLHEDARYAVQVFLVIGGFLATRSLHRLVEHNSGTQGPGALGQLIWQRYLRLAKPYWIAVGLAVLCAVVAGWVAGHPELNHRPSAYQLLAHAFFLHDILGVEALSAGVWYVAIDFQLYCLLAMIIWISYGLSRITPISASRWVLIQALALTVVSLVWLNRHPAWDEWGLYFFGSYGLGVMCFWATRHQRYFMWMLVVATVTSVALFIEWRDRIAVAGITACVLIISERLQSYTHLIKAKPFEVLGDMSYSVFLIHYPVCLLVSTVVLRLATAQFSTNLLAFLMAWMASLMAGAVLYQLVENRRQI